jgi:hypothetical protein
VSTLGRTDRVVLWQRCFLGARMNNLSSFTRLIIAKFTTLPQV